MNKTASVNSWGSACSALVVVLGLASFVSAQAEVVYQEYGGVVVGEAEIYSSRTNDASGKSWLVIPDESVGTGTVINARGGAYIQALPDDGVGGGPLANPSIYYKMQIFTPGTYRLYLRQEGNMSINSGGNSDSMFADIVEIKDGTAGVFGSATNAVADWYEFTPGVDGNFATTPWYTTSQPEVNQAGAGGYSANWVIKREGTYTLRLTVREDGCAVDAWVFQLSSLPAPTDDGPAMSPLTPSRCFIGAAADTYLKRADATTAHGSETDLLIKNDDTANLSGLDRNTYLRFDLSSLAGLTNDTLLVTNATLKIDQVSEGTTTNHAIYVAVIAEDATAETFDENLLTPNTSDVWSTSNDEGVNFSKVFGNAPIGSFISASSNNNKTVTFSSQALVNAIRADTDGVLSLVLYRTFDNPAGADTFASKEHATLNQPRLVLDIGHWRGTMIMLQ